MSWRDEYAFRPMRRSDLELLLTWRNSNRIRGNMYSDHIISWEEHTAWFERTQNGNTSLHFIFESQGVPRGVVNVTAIDRAHGRCVWGFYIGDAEAPRGTGSAMGFFALEHLFETLGFHRVIGEAFAFNSDSINFHKRLGFIEEGRLVEHILRRGRYEDIVTLGLLADGWKKIKPELVRKFFTRNHSACET